MSGLYCSVGNYSLWLMTMKNSQKQCNQSYFKICNFTAKIIVFTGFTVFYFYFVTHLFKLYKGIKFYSGSVYFLVAIAGTCLLGLSPVVSCH